MSEDIHLNKGDGSAGSKLREWSSLIGIVTAIVGNVLISFALNIQRYAHLRLKRGEGDSNRPWSKKRRKLRASGYGSQQDEVAEERARLNLTRSFSDRLEPAKSSSPANGDPVGNQDQRQDDDPAFSLHSRRSSNSYTEDEEKKIQEDEQKNYLKSPYWWIGLTFMVVGEAGNFLAYGFAPASTVSPLGVVALISNCIIAPCLLKERFRQRDFWGVCVAVAGAVIIVFSANNSETKFGPSDIWSAITRWEFMTYLGITAVLIAILMWASSKYGERSILIDLGLVGLFGGYTALTTKGVASLLSDTLWRTLTFPVTYLLLLILVVTALMQIRYVNRALQRFDSTQVIPTQFVLFTISVIVGSAILYRDFKSASGDQIGKFIGGCLLTFLGVYLITSGRRPERGYEAVSDSDRAEGPIRLVDEERYENGVGNQGDIDGKDSITASPVDLVDGTTPRRSSEQQHPTSPMILSPTRPRVSSQSSSTISPTSPYVENRDLVVNPWNSADDVRNTQHPPLEGTVSSPVLPSEAIRAQPTTPPDTGQSYRRNSVQSPTIPETPPPLGRPSTLSRRSIAHLTPGPYMSPLSSPLRVVVADSIRKGREAPYSRYQRPRLSGLRRTRSNRAVTGSTSDIPNVSTPLKGVQPQDDDISAGGRAESPRSRSRSLSTTLGDFFHVKRERGKGKQSQIRPDEDA